MPGFKDYLKKIISGETKQPDGVVQKQPVHTTQYVGSINLRARASKNFEKYLNLFLNTGETTGLPASRLSESEWKQLSSELQNLGVTFVLGTRNGVSYYWFSKYEKTPEPTSLRARASKNFEKYLNLFLTTGETTGLPHQRLSESEWEQLNSELKGLGVVLVPKTKDGYLYYFFSRYYKQNEFVAGQQRVETQLIQDIKKKYPGISEQMIKQILASESLDTDTIYDILRRKQDGQYTDVSKQEFEKAFYYAMTSAYNGIDIVNSANVHKWAGADEFVEKYGIRYFPDDKWPTNKYIIMHGRQGWTWFRSCDGDTEQPVHDPNHPDGFHISLNVRVTKDLLHALDNILIQDAGKYINSYKFPKANRYDSILSRHDPVTIYTNARNPSLEKQITQAVAPYVRSNDGMIGESLGYGVCINEETSSQGISVGQKISYEIAKMIHEYRNRN